MIKIKICGITEEKEAEWLNEAKVDFAGFVVFFPKSRRNISIEKAQAIMKLLNPEIRTVAVTVSPSLEEIQKIETANFSFVQIHGAVSDEVMEHCRIPVLKAFNVNDLSDFEAYQKKERVAGYVFDAQFPGSGQTFDWKELNRMIPGTKSVDSFFQEQIGNGKIVLLAGGLNPENVEEAIRRTGAPGVDVSSGVENGDKRGKNRDRIFEFVKQARK